MFFLCKLLFFVFLLDFIKISAIISIRVQGGILC